MADETSKDNFEEQLFALLETRKDQLDITELPKAQDEYRLHLSCVRNIIEALKNKSLIISDPYKKEKKISKIECPDNTAFTENERAKVLGLRISDYESMVDFVCNYMKFSVDQLPMEKVHQLANLNDTFIWNNLSTGSNKPNTKALATVLNEAKSGAQQITLGLINDSISKAAESIQNITATLKTLTEFQKQLYKADIRKQVLANPQFNRAKAYQSAADMQAEIKRLYTNVMGKRAFVPELVTELVAEEVGPDKQRNRDRLVAMLSVAKKKTRKKEDAMNTHEVLMNAVRSLGGFSDQYTVVIEKFIQNHDVIETEHNTTGRKFIKFIRKIFGLSEPSVEYEIMITESGKETPRRERIRYNEFMVELNKRAKFYASFNAKQSSGYSRLNAMQDEGIIEFINKHVSENTKLFSLLAGLDDFFKNSVSAMNRSKIKGIKMELSALKNNFIRVNQYRAEYTAYVEEKAQLKKLGISDDV